MSHLLYYDRKTNNKTNNRSIAFRPSRAVRSVRPRRWRDRPGRKRPVVFSTFQGADMEPTSRRFFPMRSPFSDSTGRTFKLYRLKSGRRGWKNIEKATRRNPVFGILY